MENLPQEVIQNQTNQNSENIKNFEILPNT